MSRYCLTCQGPVAELVGSGRPRIFCSARCRREMAVMRDELVDLEQQLVDARTKEWGFWPGRHYWLGEVRRLELAIQELQQRIPG